MTGQPFTLLVDIPLKPGRADEGAGGAVNTP
jgi:hypothetical protein